MPPAPTELPLMAKKVGTVAKPTWAELLRLEQEFPLHKTFRLFLQRFDAFFLAPRVNRNKWKHWQ